jgi:hypothetical protein
MLDYSNTDKKLNVFYPTAPFFRFFDPVRREMRNPRMQLTAHTGEMMKFFCSLKFRRATISPVILLILTYIPSPVSAQTTTGMSVTLFDNARPAGQATLRWLGFRVFDAALFTPRGQQYSDNLTVALRLDYHMRFSRSDLVTATVSELKRLEGTQPDHKELETLLGQCFADVTRRDSFLAYGATRDKIAFYRNGARTCELSSPDIRSRVLAVWLSPESRFPALSRKLRGQE